MQQELASTDSLTGLLNSRAFFSAAERELARQRRSKAALTMAYLDVDNFKAVNTQLGHMGADEVLRQSAHAMKRALRVTDTIGRVGGDEFAILLPDSDPAQVKGVLDRLRREVLAANKDQKMVITVSVGAVVFAEPATSVNAMLEESDELMYLVKREAKDAAQVRLVGVPA
jgi:diguanylate cyclase (GGDEF)-like protein